MKNPSASVILKEIETQFIASGKAWSEHQKSEKTTEDIKKQKQMEKELVEIFKKYEEGAFVDPEMNENLKKEIKEILDSKGIEGLLNLINTAKKEEEKKQ